MKQTSIVEFNQWLKYPENYNLECKKATNSFNRDKDLADYCSALANEGGGKLILGVEDKTHKVLGTNAFIGTFNTLAHDLYNKLNIRIDITASQKKQKRF